MGELNAAILISNISFSYGHNKVLNDISVNIESSKLTVILGKNGCGKSTLLRLIAGLLPCMNGEIRIRNQEIRTLTLNKMAKLVGFLGQKHRAVFPFTVEQVVLTGRAGYVNVVPKAKDKEVAGYAMERAGIQDLKDRFYTELSGGEQQLVMIARVLAQEPEILLLDEPASHLDFANQIKLMSLLKELTLGDLTVVAVLHDHNLAFLYGDDFIFIRKGDLLRPVEPVKPWDAEFMQTIYGNKLHSIPYCSRALIVPATETIYYDNR